VLWHQFCLLLYFGSTIKAYRGEIKKRELMLRFLTEVYTLGIGFG